MRLFILILALTFSFPQQTVARKKQVTEEVTISKKAHINNNYWDRQVVCHRGYKGFPENTLIAFEEAIVHGFKTVECDVAFSKDNIAVLSHDATVDRCSNFRGKIIDYDINTLSMMDFARHSDPKFRGENIATLKELLLTCHRFNVMIDIDCANKERFPNSRYLEVYNLVKKYDMLGSVMFCDKAENLKVLLDIDPNVIVSIAHCKTLEDVDKAMEVAQKARFADFTFNHKDITPEIITKLHSQGFMVRCWTVNKLANLKKFVEMGVDKITSDELGPKFDYPITKQFLILYENMHLIRN